MNVTATSHTNGTTGIHAYRPKPALTTQTVTSRKQPAASNWFEMPKIGTIALMPPLASETPM